MKRSQQNYMVLNFKKYKLMHTAKRKTLSQSDFHPNTNTLWIKSEFRDPWLGY